MSAISKAYKKLSHNIKKVIGKEAYKAIGGNMWALPIVGPIKGKIDSMGSVWKEYKRNEGTYNRLGATIVASILTGGAAGLAGGAGFAAGATVGGVTGTIAGGTNAYGEIKTKEAIEEQQRIAEQAAAEEERLQKLKDLKARGDTPENQLNILYANRNALISQHKRNQKSRDAQNTLGAGSSTLA